MWLENNSDVFGAIAAPVRREILVMLAVEPMPVLKIASAFQMSVPAVSQHLAVLKNAKLVTQEKLGRQRIYRLTAEPLEEVFGWLKQYEPFWPAKLDELEKYLDKKHEETDI